jgi:hypothetical protein
MASFSEAIVHNDLDAKLSSEGAKTRFSKKSEGFFSEIPYFLS